MDNNHEGILITSKENKKQKKHIVFDEETIKEHDKQRGNKMKIDEPKTPYEFADEQQKQKMKQQQKEKLEKINFDLNEELENQRKEQQEKKEKEAKHKAFLEKRRNHYKNEFNKV